VSNELAKIQEEQNVLSFQNLMRSSVRFKISRRHLFMNDWESATVISFIDEFQDTSEMQWQNLIPLIDALAGQDDYGRKEL
jgi:hypothetical protein